MTLRTGASRYTVWLLLMLSLLLAGCEEAPPPAGPQYDASPSQASIPLYRLAIHPLFTPSKLTEIYQPLIDYLNREIPTARFQLEGSRDYQAYEAKYRAREAEFLLPNPWQTLQAMALGYGVIAMAGDAEDFKGLIVVRRDSAIREPADLKGKAISYPSHTALAACIMPQYFLHSHGIDVRRDTESRYVGSMDSSLMSVYLGQVAAGGVWPPPWRAFQRDYPEEAAQLRVIWETPPLLNNSIMVRDDVPVVLRERVAQLLYRLNDTPEGRQLLNVMETARFHPADDASYAPLRTFIDRFEREVRPVKEK